MTMVHDPAATDDWQPTQPAIEPTQTELLAWEHAKKLHGRYYQHPECAECYPDGPPEPMPMLGGDPPPAAKPTSTGGMLTLGEVFDKLRAKGMFAPTDPTPAPPEPEPCARCQGGKFVRHDVPVGDYDFGRAIPCPDCYAPQLEAQRLAALLGGAGVPPLYQHCHLHTFPVTAKSQASFDRWMAWWESLKQGRADRNSAFVWGLPSVGKSALAAGFLEDFSTSTGIAGTWINVADALDAIRATYNDPNAEGHDLIKRLGAAPFLVLDDLGVEQQTPWVSEKLMQIVGSRHDTGLPTIITSNLAPDVLEEHLRGAIGRNAGAGQQQLANLRAKRLLERIVEMATIIEFRGDNLRDPDTRRRLGLAALHAMPNPIPLRLFNSAPPVDPAELVPDKEDDHSDTAF